MGTNNKQEAYWVDELGVKYTKDKTCLLQAPMGLKCYTVYHGTKTIGDNAFYISKHYCPLKSINNSLKHA